MHIILASCPTCGSQELTHWDIWLVVCSYPPWSYYSFGCKNCLREVCKPAGQEQIKLLIQGGVTPEYWNVPPEATEEHTGPPLTYDELLEFHERLKVTGNLVGVAQTFLGDT